MPTLAHQEYLDALPSEWQRVRLGDLGEVHAGSTPRRSEPKYWSGHIPWLTPSEVTGRADKWVGKTDEYITDEGYDSTSVHLVPEGSLLVTTRATIGEVVIADVPITTNQGFKNLVLGSDDVPLFYYYVLRFVADEMERLASGSTFDEISKSDFVDIVVPQPSPAEQRRIADVLDTVDAAIQKTDDVVEKQEQVKTGLLQDLLTRGLNADGELRDPEQEPQAFQKSDLLGWVPRQWEMTRLEGLFASGPRNGYSPKQLDEWTGVVMLGLGCLTPEGFEPKQLKNAPADDEKIERAMLEDGDLLVSRSNTRERVALAGIYRDVGVPCIYPDLMMRIDSNSKTSNRFLELLLGHQPVRRQLTAAAQGTSGSMVKINASILKNAIVPLPEREEQSRILERYDESSHRIESERSYRGKLQSLKTGIMQDLLTGRVRVSEVETRVDEVVA